MQKLTLQNFESPQTTTLLDSENIKTLLKRLKSDWEITPDQKKLFKIFHFENHYQSIAFMTAITWMTHFKDHPPKLTVDFNVCIVSYTTPAINGLSEYDFLCAMKVNRLLEEI